MDWLAVGRIRRPLGAGILTAMPPAPPWAFEHVVVEDADPNWLTRGETECARLRWLLGAWGVTEVEHIGSTAVAGLAAKPIIDVMARVQVLADVGEDMLAALGAEGWSHVPPDLDGRDWRKFFVRASGGKREAHLHVLDAHSPRWAKQLAFRDALRCNPTLAADYASLKRSLAARFAEDREAYTDGKTAFVERVLRG